MIFDKLDKAFFVNKYCGRVDLSISIKKMYHLNEMSNYEFKTTLFEESIKEISSS